MFEITYVSRKSLEFILAKCQMQRDKYFLMYNMKVIDLIISNILLNKVHRTIYKTTGRMNGTVLNFDAT